MKIRPTQSYTELRRYTEKWSSWRAARLGWSTTFWCSKWMAPGSSRTNVNYYVDCGRLAVREDSGGVCFSYTHKILHFLGF